MSYPVCALPPTPVSFKVLQALFSRKKFWPFRPFLFSRFLRRGEGEGRRRARRRLYNIGNRNPGRRFFPYRGLEDATGGFPPLFFGVFRIVFEFVLSLANVGRCEFYVGCRTLPMSDVASHFWWESFPTSELQGKGHFAEPDFHVGPAEASREFAPARDRYRAQNLHGRG